MASHHYLTTMTALVFLAMVRAAIPAGAQVGVCYGGLGDNLPPASEVVALYRSNNIKRMRLYTPGTDVLQALKGSGIELLLDVPNTDLQRLAGDPSAASTWVQNNVKAYSQDVKFRYIAVGNEVIPGDLAQYVLPAMRNVQNAINSAGLQNQVKVSTSVIFSVLGTSYPPSAGAFGPDAQTQLGPIVQFLARNGAPLLVNIYPYFSYKGNPNSISLPYALFTAPGTVVSDGQYNYQNLFDAMVDAVYSALERTGGSNVGVVVSESGWPSAGDNGPATVDNARTYNSKLIEHVGRGTPKRSGPLETYVFAMFNENQKSPELEKHFGLFYPSKQPVYPVSF